MLRRVDGNQILEVVMVTSSATATAETDQQQEAEDEEFGSKKELMMKKIQLLKRHDSRLAARIETMNV